MIITVQGYGMNSPGGGARILRSLFENAPLPSMSVTTLPDPAPATKVLPESHMAMRPSFGRLEKSRFRPMLKKLELVYANRNKKRLRAFAEQNKVKAFHAVAHDYDHVIVQQVAEEMGVPYILSIHDDVYYNNRREDPKFVQALLKGSEVCWKKADELVLITEALGEEYGRRYGKKPYIVVTDGLTSITPPREGRANTETLYFMGMIHLSYYDNMDATCQALKLLNQQTGSNWKFVIRGSDKPMPFASAQGIAEMRPFGSDADVKKDMEEADLLYLPLPFGEEHAVFVRLSLSTKMVSYAGSGIPMIFHGPADAAAGLLLEKYNAAGVATSKDPQQIADAILAAHKRGNALAVAAGKLAEDQFMLKDQREKFWSAIKKHI